MLAASKGKPRPKKKAPKPVVPKPEPKEEEPLLPPLMPQQPHYVPVQVSTMVPAAQGYPMQQQYVYGYPGAAI